MEIFRSAKFDSIVARWTSSEEDVATFIVGGGKIITLAGFEPDCEEDSDNLVLLERHDVDAPVVDISPFYHHSPFAVCALSSGSLALFSTSSQKLELKADLEVCKTSLNKVCVSDSLTAAVACDDGSLSLVNLSSMSAADTVIKPVSGCPLTGVAHLAGKCFVSSSASISGKSTSIVVSDARSASIASSFCDRPILSVAAHPSGGSVLLAGGCDGGLSVWDIRQTLLPLIAESAPASVPPVFSRALPALPNSISDISFFPAFPHIVGTVTTGGHLSLWNVDWASIDPTAESGATAARKWFQKKEVHKGVGGLQSVSFPPKEDSRRLPPAVLACGAVDGVIVSTIPPETLRSGS